MLRTITRIAVTFALALAATPLAAAPAAKEVEAEGFHFAYTVEIAGDKIVLAGKDLDRDEKFELTVKPSGKVVGWVGNRAVEFSVDRRKRDAIFARLMKQQPAEATEVAEAAPVASFPAR